MVQYGADFERGLRGLGYQLQSVHMFSHLTPYEVSNMIPFDVDA